MPTKLYPLTDTHPRRPLHHTAPQPSRARRRVRSHADTPLLRRACGEEGETEKTTGNHGHPFVPEALEPIRTPRFVPSLSSALRLPPSSALLLNGRVMPGDPSLLCVDTPSFPGSQQGFPVPFDRLDNTPFPKSGPARPPDIAYGRGSLSRGRIYVIVAPLRIPKKDPNPSGRSPPSCEIPRTGIRTGNI